MGRVLAPPVSSYDRVSGWCAPGESLFPRFSILDNDNRTAGQRNGQSVSGFCLCQRLIGIFILVLKNHSFSHPQSSHLPILLAFQDTMNGLVRLHPVHSAQV